MFSILSALSRRNAEVIEAEMAHNPSLFPWARVRGEEGPSASASRPRRGLASRLIGTFIGLCQFGKEWHLKILLLFRHHFLPSLSNLPDRLDTSRSPSIPTII